MPKRKDDRRDGGEEPLDEEGSAPRARPFWSGTISFGLVTIPVDLYAATRTVRTSLRMLAPSGTPVVRRYFTEAGKPVDSADLERGYELEDERFVVVTDEELESLAPEQSRDIDLSRFVRRDEIPALFAERAYIMAPAGNSSLAYRLLASTLERTKRAGLASFVMRGKQHAVAIIGERGLLRAETLRFAEEIRSPEDVGLPAPEKPSAELVKSMRAAIGKATHEKVAARELSDSYWKRLEALVEQKHRKRQDIVTPAPTEGEDENLAEVIDLVAVLRKSLGQAAESERQEPEKKAPPRSATRKASRPRKSAPKKVTPAKKKATKKTSTRKRAAHGR